MAIKRSSGGRKSSPRSKRRGSKKPIQPKSGKRVRAKAKRGSRAASIKGRNGTARASGLRLQTGLRLLRTEKSISSAARKSGLSEKQLRSQAIKKKLLVKRGKRWVVEKDVPRKLLVYSDGREHVITVSKFKSASLVGEYMAGVRWFVQTNDLRHLEPFAGKAVKDASGKRFPFETRPNVLHRLANSGGSSFEDVYRLVI